MKKILLKNVLLGATFCLIGQNYSVAQEYKCGTTEAHQKLYALHPELAQAEIDNNALIAKQIEIMKQSKAVEHVYTIPVVFHILHTNGVENISDAQVKDEINILNRDWGKLNADTSLIVAPFQALAANMKVQFRLAQKDPEGNCTNGIDRIYSHKTDNANDDSKLNPWPRDKYLNVWVIRTMENVSAAGYAYYPSASDPWYMQPYDGIIIIHSYIGSIGTASVGTSRALTHEVGHWLNLQHTWGSTNNPTVACGDDAVTDTPITKGHDNCTNRFDYTCDSKALTGTYTFGSVTTSSGTMDPTAVPQTIDSAIAFTKPVATGVSANSATAGVFEFSNWDTGALNGETAYASLTGSINTSKYYEFTITPELAQALTLTGLTFTVNRDTNGIRTFAVRSSADGYAANLAASISPANPNLSIQAGNVFFINTDITTSLVGSKITLSGASFVNINNASRTFRIYGWNAEDVTGTFGVDNIALTGTHGIVENVENYMEYSYCSKMFTYDQKLRTRAALIAALSGRNNLWINSNLIATGTDGTAPVCVPTTDFYADDNMICPGANVAFTPNVLDLPTTATATYAWSFPGGSPATSTSASPTVSYSAPGSYDVTLTVGSSLGGGTNTVTKPAFIFVNDPLVTVPGTYTEGFENASEFYSNWRVNDLDDNAKTWYRNNLAAYTGSNSIVMNAYYNYRNDVDQLISPSYDLTFATTGTTLTFRCAAATHATAAVDMNDKLVVYSSIDCGETWAQRASFTGTALLNNSYHPEEFIPSDPSQWALKTVNVPSTVCTAKTRFKFEYTAGNEGNSIFIDDINMNTVMGIDENNMLSSNVSIYPNPANETTTVSYHLNTKGDTKMEVVDVLGKKLMEVKNSNQAEGDYTVQISKNELHLTNGIYFVKFSVGNATITKKLIISE